MLNNMDGISIIENESNIHYRGVLDTLNDDTVGCWCYYYDKGGREYTEKVSVEAIQRGVVTEIKHSNAEAGKCCFYLNVGDIEGHKRVIKYMLEKGLIRKTPKGRVFDVGFYLKSGLNCGIRLSSFINTETGAWLV